LVLSVSREHLAEQKGKISIKKEETADTAVKYFCLVGRQAAPFGAVFFCAFIFLFLKNPTRIFFVIVFESLAL